MLHLLPDDSFKKSPIFSKIIFGTAKVHKWPLIRNPLLRLYSFYGLMMCKLYAHILTSTRTTTIVNDVLKGLKKCNNVNKDKMMRQFFVFFSNGLRRTQFKSGMVIIIIWARGPSFVNDFTLNLLKLFWYFLQVQDTFTFILSRL